MDPNVLAGTVGGKAPSFFSVGAAGVYTILLVRFLLCTTYIPGQALKRRFFSLTSSSVGTYCYLLVVIGQSTRLIKNPEIYCVQFVCMYSAIPPLQVLYFVHTQYLSFCMDIHIMDM